MNKLLKQIEKYILLATIFLFPVIVLSISPNIIVVPKLVILVFGISLALLIRVARIIATGKFEMRVGRYDFPVFLILVAYLLSAVFATPNKMEAFLLPGTATVITVGALLYFLINQFQRDKKTFELTFLSAVALLSLITVASFIGILNKIPQLPPALKANSFTPEGGYLPIAIITLVMLPIGIGLLISEKNLTKKVIAGVASVIVVIGLFVSVYSILPGRPTAPRFPSMGVSWAISIETLKQSPLFGVGAGNYLTAFGRFRPIQYNNSDIWAVRFNTASDFYMTVLTEAGLLGFAGVILLLYSLYKRIRADLAEKRFLEKGFSGNYELVSLLLIVLIGLVFPASLLIVVSFFLLFSLVTKSKPTSLSLIAQSKKSQRVNVASRLPAIIIALPLLIVVLLVDFQGVKIVRAEYTFKKSLDSLAKNQANETVRLMQTAVNLNPRVDRYRITLSRIYLLGANSMIQNLTSQTAQGEQPQVTDQDRVNISQLIQGSITEAKNAVALNPLRAGNWETLASTYRAIMPLAQGADQFAIQTYNQAVALDPINPNLRISLGGVYYAIGDFDSASRVFERAVAVKPDLANSHYNYAFALRELGQYDAAIQQMSLVLSQITDTSSQDYQVAKQALDDMQSKKAEKAASSQNLNAPKEGEQVLKPPLDLPEEAQPPESPISPTPTETPSEEGAEGATGTVTVTTTPSPTNTPTPRP